MVIYPLFIRLFYFNLQSIVLNTKVSFHFHLHNYCMYKLVSLLTFYSSGIDSTNGTGGLISALTRWISLQTQHYFFLFLRNMF